MFPLLRSVSHTLLAPRLLRPRLCLVRLASTADVGSQAPQPVQSSASPASPPSTPPSRDSIARSAVAEANAAARVSGIFYDPAIFVTKRQRQVFTTLEDEPPLPLMDDHGYLYHTTEAELSGRSDMVRRVLSTRTAATQGVLAFRRSEILRKYAPKANDTGAGRVQVAMLTERINRLSAHLKGNKHDLPCKRSLTALTVRRRKVLEYMTREDYGNYRLMVRELDMRPVPLFNSRHLPKVRTETHKQVKLRHARLKNRVSRGSKGH